VKSVLAAFALVAAVPVAAAPPSAPPPAANPADPAALAAAERLMDAMNYDKLMDQMMDAMIAQAKQSMPAQLEEMATQSDAKLPPEFKEKLIALVMDSLGRMTKENKVALRRETALIYARHFTVAEIDRLTELQKDPVMLKMQTEMPAIMAESVAMSQTVMAEEMPRMMEELKKMVADYVAQHAKTDAS
jgi:hypothetical protein